CFSIHFFLQAEDGIRDFHVTGVQTCALPIWGAMEISMRDWAAAKKDPMKRKIATNAAAPPALAAGNEADFLAAAIYFHSSVRVLLSRRHQGAVGARPGSGRGAPA